MANKQWIQSATSPATKGDLHRALGVPQGEKIPLAKLQKAAKAGGHLGKMANFAINTRNLGKK